MDHLNLNNQIHYKVNRIYHTWDKWECFKAGFFEVRPPKGLSEEDCVNLYKELLRDAAEFKRVSLCVISEWANSCEHNLTNERMNRIAWIGQSALCYKYGVPARFRGGYNLLSDSEKIEADKIALEIINLWMESKGYELQTLESIKSKTEANLY